jgi:hypothetical protein
MTLLQSLCHDFRNVIFAISNFIVCREQEVAEAVLVYLLFIFNYIKVKKKVKLSRNRPWRPIGLRDVKDPTLSNLSISL